MPETVGLKLSRLGLSPSAEGWVGRWLQYFAALAAPN